MSHYFVYDPELKSHEKLINFVVFDKEISLISDSGVFSNKAVDKGSLFFVKTLLSQNLNGKVLDLGCGYGTVGITLKLFLKDKIDITFSDVNPKCVELTSRLTSRNLRQYDLDGKCSLSDGYLLLNGTFDFIVFNPPISIGKEKIYKLYKDSKEHLNEKGKLYLVIRKDKGAYSHMEYLKTLFNSVEIIDKEKGYFVIECL